MGISCPADPAHTSSSEPGDRLVDLALRNDAALNSVDDLGDLGLEIGGDHHVVPGLNGQHCGGAF